jgi:hypothetical protein
MLFAYFPLAFCCSKSTAMGKSRAIGMRRMEAGFEPLTQSPSSLDKNNTGSHPRPQGNKSPPDLQEIIAVWQILPDPLKAAVLAIIRTVAGGGR